ncbi:alpha-L-rhamnosidase C-terminal domain-containing protein [Streptomyces sp. NPDC005302]|uniref:alpha-L-rhamnosidase-related protein n=1 Tax=Streptomyces sp. NPDC005302 TaxID=3154675 RepID=UPI0033AA5D45
MPIIAGYYTAANDMAKIAKVLGKKADQHTYTALAAQLADEFTTRFRHQDTTGVYYGSDSETSNAMALDAGLVPADDQPQVLARLVASVRTAGNHITSGSVGLGPLFRALQAGGRDDVIYDMAVNPTSPGYGYLVNNGYTTLPESLDGSGSQNHHFLGQIDSWLIKGLAGIGQSAGSVAYRNLDISPAVVGDLTHASGSYDTPQGTVTSAWHKDSRGRLTLKVTIPAGSTATVHVPATAGTRVRAGGSTTPTPLDRTATTASYRVGAGDFTFQAG